MRCVKGLGGIKVHSKLEIKLGIVMDKYNSKPTTDNWNAVERVVMSYVNAINKKEKNK